MESGDQLRDQALVQVADHADAEWMKAAYRVVRLLAGTHRPFTTDSVWVMLESTGYTTHELRALGAVIRAAQKDQLIEPTGAWRKSSRPQCHSRPVREWVGV